MQASLIKLGGDYAVNYDNREVPLRISEIITTRGIGKTTSQVSGWSRGEGLPTHITVDVKDVIDVLENHVNLVAKREEAERARLSERREFEEQQWLACKMLARLLNAQAVRYCYKHSVPKGETFVPWDDDKPAVSVTGTSITINRHAIANAGDVVVTRAGGLKPVGSE